MVGMVTSTMLGQFFYWNRSTGKGARGNDRHCKARKSSLFSKDASLTLLYEIIYTFVKRALSSSWKFFPKSALIGYFKVT